MAFKDVVTDIKAKEQLNLQENLARKIIEIDNEIAALTKHKEKIFAAGDDPNLTVADTKKLYNDGRV